MAIVHRRVFYGKVGMGDPIVKQLREGERLFKRHRLKVKMRVLTDWQSGRTDRVVWEWETESLEAMDAQLGQLMAKGASRKAFDAWFQKLTGLIHYAEVENWMVQ
jgi:hypothetical protein